MTHEPIAKRIFFARAGRDEQGEVIRSPDAQRVLLAGIEADLRELLEAPTETLRRMVAMQATSARCTPPAGPALRHNVAPIELPRVQPDEVVRQFAARGMAVRAEDGKLVVWPADRLNEADRRMLSEYKPAILAALTRPAAVI